MQIETILTTKPAAHRRYERVLNQPTTKANFTFLYIGKNEQNKQFLDSLFYNGFAAENFEDAVQKYERSVYKTVDVLFVDSVFSETELRSFRCFLQTELGDVPLVIYNSKFILNKQV